MAEHEASFTWGAGPHTVYLAGGFNDWSPTATPLLKQPDGSFRVTIPIPYGSKQPYKYIVDGEWMVREDEQKEPDAAGNHNNIYIAPSAPSTSATGAGSDLKTQTLASTDTQAQQAQESTDSKTSPVAAVTAGAAAVAGALGLGALAGRDKDTETEARDKAQLTEAEPQARALDTTPGDLADNQTGQSQTGLPATQSFAAAQSHTLGSATDAQNVGAFAPVDAAGTRAPGSAAQDIKADPTTQAQAQESNKFAPGALAAGALGAGAAGAAALGAGALGSRQGAQDQTLTSAPSSQDPTQVPQTQAMSSGAGARGQSQERRGSELLAASAPGIVTATDDSALSSRRSSDADSASGGKPKTEAQKAREKAKKARQKAKKKAMATGAFPDDDDTDITTASNSGYATPNVLEDDDVDNEATPRAPAQGTLPSQSALPLAAGAAGVGAVGAGLGAAAISKRGDPDTPAPDYSTTGSNQPSGIAGDIPSSSSASTRAIAPSTGVGGAPVPASSAPADATSFDASVDDRGLAATTSASQVESEYRKYETGGPSDAADRRELGAEAGLGKDAIGARDTVESQGSGPSAGVIGGVLGGGALAAGAAAVAGKLGFGSSQTEEDKTTATGDQSTREVQGQFPTGPTGQSATAPGASYDNQAQARTEEVRDTEGLNSKAGMAGAAGVGAGAGALAYAVSGRDGDSEKPHSHPGTASETYKNGLPVLGSSGAGDARDQPDLSRFNDRETSQSIPGSTGTGAGTDAVRDGQSLAATHGTGGHGIAGPAALGAGAGVAGAALAGSHRDENPLEGTRSFAAGGDPSGATTGSSPLTGTDVATGGVPAGGATQEFPAGQTGTSDRGIGAGLATGAAGAGLGATGAALAHENAAATREGAAGATSSPLTGTDAATGGIATGPDTARTLTTDPKTGFPTGSQSLSADPKQELDEQGRPRTTSFTGKALAIGAGAAGVAGAAAAALGLGSSKQLSVEEAQAQGIDVKSLPEREGPTDAPTHQDQPPEGAVQDLQTIVDGLKKEEPGAATGAGLTGVGPAAAGAAAVGAGAAGAGLAATHAGSSGGHPLLHKDTDFVALLLGRPAQGVTDEPQTSSFATTGARDTESGRSGLAAGAAGAAGVAGLGAAGYAASRGHDQDQTRGAALAGAAPGDGPVAGTGPSTAGADAPGQHPLGTGAAAALGRSHVDDAQGAGRNYAPGESTGAGATGPYGGSVGGVTTGPSAVSDSRGFASEPTERSDLAAGRDLSSDPAARSVTDTKGHVAGTGAGFGAGAAALGAGALGAGAYAASHDDKDAQRDDTRDTARAAGADEDENTEAPPPGRAPDLAPQPAPGVSTEQDPLADFASGGAPEPGTEHTQRHHRDAAHTGHREDSGILAHTGAENQVLPRDTDAARDDSRFGSGAALGAGALAAGALGAGAYAASRGDAKETLRDDRELATGPAAVGGAQSFAASPSAAREEAGLTGAQTGYTGQTGQTGQTGTDHPSFAATGPPSGSYPAEGKDALASSRDYAAGETGEDNYDQSSRGLGAGTLGAGAVGAGALGAAAYGASRDENDSRRDDIATRDATGTGAPGQSFAASGPTATGVHDAARDADTYGTGAPTGAQTHEYRPEGEDAFSAPSARTGPAATATDAPYGTQGQTLTSEDASRYAAGETGEDNYDKPSHGLGTGAALGGGALGAAGLGAAAYAARGDENESRRDDLSLQRDLPPSTDAAAGITGASGQTGAVYEQQGAGYTGQPGSTQYPSDTKDALTSSRYAAGETGEDNYPSQQGAGTALGGGALGASGYADRTQEPSSDLTGDRSLSGAPGQSFATTGPTDTKAGDYAQGEEREESGMGKGALGAAAGAAAAALGVGAYAASKRDDKRDEDVRDEKDYSTGAPGQSFAATGAAGQDKDYIGQPGQTATYTGQPGQPGQIGTAASGDGKEALPAGAAPATGAPGQSFAASGPTAPSQTGFAGAPTAGIPGSVPSATGFNGTPPVDPRDYPSQTGQVGQTGDYSQTQPQTHPGMGTGAALGAGAGAAALGAGAYAASRGDDKDVSGQRDVPRATDRDTSYPTTTPGSAPVDGSSSGAPGTQTQAHGADQRYTAQSDSPGWMTSALAAGALGAGAAGGAIIGREVSHRNNVGGTNAEVTEYEGADGTGAPMYAAIAKETDGDRTAIAGAARGNDYEERMAFERKEMPGQTQSFMADEVQTRGGTTTTAVQQTETPDRVQTLVAQQSPSGDIQTMMTDTGPDGTTIRTAEEPAFQPGSGPEYLSGPKADSPGSNDSYGTAGSGGFDSTPGDNRYETAGQQSSGPSAGALGVGAAGVAALGAGAAYAMRSKPEQQQQQQPGGQFQQSGAQQFIQPQSRQAQGADSSSLQPTTSTDTGARTPRAPGDYESAVGAGAGTHGSAFIEPRAAGAQAPTSQTGALGQDQYADRRQTDMPEQTRTGDADRHIPAPGPTVTTTRVDERGPITPADVREGVQLSPSDSPTAGNNARYSAQTFGAQTPTSTHPEETGPDHHGRTVGYAAGAAAAGAAAAGLYGASRKPGNGEPTAPADAASANRRASNREAFISGVPGVGKNGGFLAGTPEGAQGQTEKTQSVPQFHPPAPPSDAPATDAQGAGAGLAGAGAGAAGAAAAQQVSPARQSAPPPSGFSGPTDEPKTPTKERRRSSLFGSMFKKKDRDRLQGADAEPMPADAASAQAAAKAKLEAGGEQPGAEFGMPSASAHDAGTVRTTGTIGSIGTTGTTGTVAGKQQTRVSSLPGAAGAAGAGVLGAGAGLATGALGAGRTATNGALDTGRNTVSSVTSGLTGGRTDAEGRQADTGATAFAQKTLDSAGLGSGSGSRPTTATGPTAGTTAAGVGASGDRPTTPTPLKSTGPAQVPATPQGARSTHTTHTAHTTESRRKKGFFARIKAALSGKKHEN